MANILDHNLKTSVIKGGTRLTVLQVLPALELGGGGVEQSAIDVAAALQAAGHKAIVVSSGGGRLHELERAGVEHVTLPMASKNPLAMRANVNRLVRLIKEHGVDIIHARSRAPAWSARAAARRTGIPFVTTFHGTYNFSGRLKKKYNSVMASGELVIANSAFIADHVATEYDVPLSRIRTIPRGIDLRRFDPALRRYHQLAKLAAQWHVGEDVPIVLLPGRLTRWKGQELLIDALADVTLRPLRCVLVGDDQGRTGYRNGLEARVRERNLEDVVLILGHCEDMATAFLLADVVISASTDPEAFGRVVAEGQAMGTPVVVADHGGAAEQVIDGQTGWLFAPGDAKDLAAKINIALTISAERREDIALRAVAHVNERYGKERMCAATLGVYDELIAQRAASEVAQ